MDDVSCKRFKPDHTLENALNLSLGGVSSEHDRECETTVERNSHSPIFDSNLNEMRNKFQRWVIETYRDSSKTKTITAKKYERIVKTLVGEIKNCAENSKFRFWMKCKGFKLTDSSQPSDAKILLVQDKKGQEIKYKKVAVVENFFNIIYDVHVNEGARGIKHAGQKRTHRTITETYAFLPREAVTRFLLCCVNCQKRNFSTAASSSCKSIYPIGHEPVAVHISSINKPILNKLELLSPCLKYNGNNDGKGNHNGHDNDQLMITTANSENNNNRVDKEDRVTEPFNFSLKIEASDDNVMQFGSSAYLSHNKDLENTIRKCKRKRKITTKIVRPMTHESKENVRFCEYLPEERILTPETRAQEQKIDFCKSEQMDRNLATKSPQFERINTNDDDGQCTKPEMDDRKSNFTTNVRNCPYVAKISELLYNPIKYASDTERRKESISSEDFLEKSAVDLILKARRLEEIKESLTDKEKQQISLQVYSCRVISFLLNYAADLMLKSMLTDFTMDLNY